MNPTAIVAILVVVTSIAACGGADQDGDDGTGTPGADISPATRRTATGGGQDASASRGTPIRITFAGTEINARLLANATARDLAAQLPLTLGFRDHDDAEKTAPLPRRLSIGGAPAGHDPVAGDIGYYAPGGDVVLYYDDEAPYFDGIVRIGGFDGDMAGPLERLAEGALVTIERAG